MIYLLLAFAHAASTSLLLDPTPTHVLRNEVITFKPKSGYHFNLKAPQNCGDKPAEDLKNASLVCQFTSGGKQNVSLKICDEKETFCKSEDFVVEVPGVSTKEGVTQAPTRPPIDGFTADTENAVREAKAGKKILFIDFGAAWCPACNSMEETVTSTKEFRDKTSGFVRVYQDIDLTRSYPWQTKFVIHSYPTYVVADEDLNEIGRFVGTAPIAVFEKWLHAQEALKEKPLNKIDLKNAAIEDRLRVGRALVDQEKYAEALSALDGLDSRPALYVAAKAQVGLAGQDPEKLRALLPDVIAKFDDQSAVIGWTGQWLKLAPEPAKVLATIPRMIEKLKTSPDVRDEGVLDSDIYEGFAEEIEPGNPDLAKQYFSQAADAYAKMIKASGEKNPRGYNMERMYCLFHAGKEKEAVALGAKLSAYYPKDYVFNRSLARMFFKQKKYPQALKQVDLALKKAYGDMYFHIVATKGDILLGMGKKAEAHKLAEAALNKLNLPENRKLGPHYAALAIENLLKQSAN